MVKMLLRTVICNDIEVVIGLEIRKCTLKSEKNYYLLKTRENINGAAFNPFKLLTKNLVAWFCKG